MFRVRERVYGLAERTLVRVGWPDLDASAAQRSNRIVFVCSGNICRSPYAEAVARARGLMAISCGTDTRDNLPADPSAIKEAAERGIDLLTHRTTQWQSLSDLNGDTIVVAQLKHALKVLPRARASGCRVILMSALLLPNFEVVRDPFGGPEEIFKHVFDLIDKAVDRIAENRPHAMSADSLEPSRASTAKAEA